MAGIKDGDEVRVYRRYDRHNPDGYRGEVIKVARTLVTVEYAGRAEKFRIDTQRVNDGSGSVYFRTMEQVVEAKRRSEALAVLNAHKIELGRGNSLTIEQIEALADIARRF